MYPFMFVKIVGDQREVVVIIADYDLTYADEHADLGMDFLQPGIDIERERHTFKSEADAKKFIAEWWRTNVQG